MSQNNTTSLKVPKLRFREFGGDWNSNKINEVSSYVDYRGKTPTKTTSGIMLVTAKNIRFGYIDYDCSKEYVSIQDYNLVMRRGKPNIGDVLITTEAPCGNIANIDRENIALAQRVIKLRGNTSIIDNYFLKFYFLSEYFQSALDKESTGLTVKGIKGSRLLNLYISYPSFSEQQKIASFLSLADEKIEKLKNKKSLIEKYKKGVMQKLFSQEIRFKDENGEEYEAWEEKKLGEICDCLDNKRKPLNSTERNNKKGNIPYFGANGIVDYINDFLFDEELILLAEDGGNFEDYKNTPIAQRIFGKSWVNNHAHILRGKIGILDNGFLFISLVHKDITRYIVGGGRAKLNKSSMLEISIGLPSIPEQQKIASFLSEIDAKIESLGSEIERAERWKKGLLQGMFV